jgi:hypothetical protein
MKPQEGVYISFLRASIDVGEVAADHANITVRCASGLPQPLAYRLLLLLLLSYTSHGDAMIASKVFDAIPVKNHMGDDGVALIRWCWFPC